MFEDFSESGEAKTGSDVVLQPSGTLFRDETCPGPVCEGVSDLSEFGTWVEFVPDLGEARTDPSLVFKGIVDDSFHSVADIDKDEGSDTPVTIVQTKPVQISQTGEGQRRK